MICLYAESQISTSIFILYTCIWIPLLQTTQSVLKIFTYLFNPHQIPEYDHSHETPCELDLLVLHFQDLDGGYVKNENESCSICLMEFGNEDLVNKLPRCRHVFHVECMEKWLDRCQFTCPLCRSLVLPVPSSPCKMWDSGFCVLTPAGQDYWSFF